MLKWFLFSSGIKHVRSNDCIARKKDRVRSRESGSGLARMAIKNISAEMPPSDALNIEKVHRLLRQSNVHSNWNCATGPPKIVTALT